MKKIFMAMAILCTTTFILVACGNDDEQNETSAQVDDQQTVDTQDQEDEDKSGDEGEDSTDTSAKENQQSTSDGLESSSDDESALERTKAEYLATLSQTKEESDDMRENPRDGTTFAMKEVEGNLYDIWDGLLNDIYGELEEQLSSEEMDELRVEQRDWIKYRDETAKEASLKYEGGTAEQLEYVMVENNLTIERCFELVEEYMS